MDSVKTPLTPEELDELRYAMNAHDGYATAIPSGVTSGKAIYNEKAGRQAVTDMLWKHRRALLSMARQSPGSGEAVAKMAEALSALLDACRKSDGAGELDPAIGGELLDAAADALEEQYPIIWTQQQVEVLERRQADARVHPYTCGRDRSDADHIAQADEDGEEPGLLFPTVRGWRCPACDYRQFWSHETGGPKALAAPPPAETFKGFSSFEEVKMSGVLDEVAKAPPPAAAVTVEEIVGIIEDGETHGQRPEVTARQVLSRLSPTTPGSEEL